MDRSIGDMPTLPGGSERAWRGILQPGTFFGRYKVHRFLGRGGMGEVYEVEHELDGAHYAMKVLSSEIPQTPENIRRFEREAQVMARLQHPNVIGVDYFDETDGKYWFRMELARGIEEGVVTLGDLAAKNGGRIGQGLLVCLFEQILDGLSCAHEKGVIHRDLKPGNILLAHSDDITGGIVPKISDFGLVRLVGQDWLLKKTLLSAQLSLGEKATEGATDSQGLSTQSLVGTYAYMSPEQKQRKKIDERSDIYAVGLMIYRLLTGYTNPGEKIRNRDSTLHAFWQRIVDRSVREDPNDRFSSATAMLAELRRGHRVLASLDGKASLEKCRVELQAKRYYTANRYLDEAVMIFPNDPEVLEFQSFMREQLGLLYDLKNKMQDLRHQKKYDEALAAAEQFRAVCIEDKQINKLIDECPQLIAKEELRQLIEKALRFLEAGEYEPASKTAQKALSLDHENSQARRINDQAQTLLKKMQIQQTREQISKGLHQVYSLLKQKRYAEALNTLRHTPCSDSNHPKVIALRNACQAGLKKIRKYWKRVDEARASSDYQQAMSLLNEVLRSIAPEDPDTIERLNHLKREVEELSTAFAEMDHAWKNKSFKECLKAAQRILAIQPEHAKAQQYRFACLDKIKAIQMDVDKAEAYYQNQQYDEAIDAYKQIKKHYYLGKRPAKNEAEIESQHSVYSPEYKEILDRVATIHKAKTSMEKALQRAKESLEAGDLIETRLALNEYFELQTNGQEGLVLQQQLEALHRHARMMKRIRRGVVYLAVAAVLGLSLAYGAASVVASYKMQNKLEESCAALTFANLKETESEASQRLDKLQLSRLAPLFSIEARWKCWKDDLESSRSSWEDYARGAYEEGQEKLKDISPTEFTSLIQRAFDGFMQNTNALCADVNNQLVEGKYDDSTDICHAFLLSYPRHGHILDLLQRTDKARELERWMGDPNVDLKSLSDCLGGLIDISPGHPNRQEWEKQCIKRLESKYGLPEALLPTDVNDIKNVNDVKKQIVLCNDALEELALFKKCHGHQDLCDGLTKRRRELTTRLAEITNTLDAASRLAEAKDHIKRQCWVRAKEILDTLDSAKEKDEVDEKIGQLNDLFKKASEQAKQQDWFGANKTMSKLWELWNEEDTCELLLKAKKLKAIIHASMQKEEEGTRMFVEAMDQKGHTQIEKFVMDRVGTNFDLTPIYAKWFPRLNRDAQDALAQKKIDTAKDLLDIVLNNGEIISDVNDANDATLKEHLQSLSRNKEEANKRSNQALERTYKAQSLWSKEQYAGAQWYVHQALEKNCECDSADKLHDLLQRRQRVATQYWRDASMLYDGNFYFEAGRSLNTAIKEFPDLRVLALSRDLDKKTKEADEAKDDVLKRKMSVKEFYDTYPDYDQFPSNADKRIKKAVLQDLKNRLGDLSQDKKQIIVNARNSILQDDAEYQALRKKYGSGMRVPPSSDTNIANPDWCQIIFPSGIDLTLDIEGHSLKASGTAFVRCQDKIDIILKSSDRDCSRTQALSINPWKVHRITIKRSCFKEKTAEVQVVRKGWLFKAYDLDAMAEQIMREYQIDKSLAIKSLQAKLDQIKDSKDITRIQVPLIGCWIDKDFMEVKVEEY